MVPHEEMALIQGVRTGSRCPVKTRAARPRPRSRFVGRRGPRSRACAGPPPTLAVPGRVLRHNGFYISACAAGLPRCELRAATGRLGPACSLLSSRRLIPRAPLRSPPPSRPPGAMHPARPALWAAALTALTLLRGTPVARAGAGAVGAGPVVRCEPCDARALAQCAPPPTTPACTELVREPGCGCCLTCALLEGDACGVYTERCGTGLRCQPRPAEQYPLRALLNGRGFCANASAAGSLSTYLPSQPAPGKLSLPRAPRALPGTRRG